ncbi:MAG: radical SAM family heme chaperone HemW [Patescibacteria group bacterium]
MKNLNLYIHIPFCIKKCPYCAFFSVIDKNRDEKSYFENLKKEVRNFLPEIKNYKISTIFFGGGTPSFVSENLIADFLNFLKNNLQIDKNTEITIETNPESLDEKKLQIYQKSGINRISIGLQSSQDRHLKFLGRVYSFSEFLKKYEFVQRSGFKNINLDIIFGFPNQTFLDLKQTLKNVISLNPTHISCYSLEIEEGTVFDVMHKRGELFKPSNMFRMILSDDSLRMTKLKSSKIKNQKVRNKNLEILENIEILDRKMYHFAVSFLEKSGFFQYEISNFSKPNFECKHNLDFWKSNDYIGFGAGASSNFLGKRFSNPKSISSYAKLLDSKNFYETIFSKTLNFKINFENILKISENEKMMMWIILAFRTTRIGVNFFEFEKRFKKNFLKTFDEKIKILKSNRLIQIDDEKIVLTNRGKDFLGFVEKIFYEN